MKVVLPIRAGPDLTWLDLQGRGTAAVPGQACVFLPAVLRVILSHVLDEVCFLQAFVSW